jgi:hypothetical protein
MMGPSKSVMMRSIVAMVGCGSSLVILAGDDVVF